MPRQRRDPRDEARLDEICRILEDVLYKPTWRPFVGFMGGGHYLQWRFTAIDCKTGEPEIQHGRKWYISSFATKSEIVFTALAAVKMAELHELHETFLYKGRPLVNPHVDVDALTAVRQEDARQHLDN